ncbi:hypothetical protein GGR53DRAFT_309280 [Hypoxylon sp. FL1150]|nr:hypothetical protein GGR53DRAFT_309280 [Hypoxylon sp. FL1150]
MVNGLERLEKFFGASRRREKDARYRDTPAASPPSQPDNGPHFPSPSFMRPTSIHMKPREEQNPWTKAVKDRSQSMPDPQYTPKRRSSIGSTSSIAHHRQQSSDPTRMLSLSVRPVKDPLNGQKLSRFRFPEDSLFKNETVCRVSSATDEEAQVENMLDWRPQRLSSLFNTLGLDTSIDDRLARSTADVVESFVAKPSPIVSTPPSPKTRVEPVIQTRPSSQSSTEFPARKLPFLPRLDVLSSVTKTFPDSPPASDEEDNDYSPFSRPTSRKGLGSPIVFTPRASTESRFRNSTEAMSSHTRSVRESWGARPEDNVAICANNEGQIRIAQPHSIRKSTSESSLFTVRATMIKHLESDRGMTEPTLDDFYALDDEDVAESFPTTPELDTDVPPTPPPKDSAKTIIGRSRSTRHAPIAPTSTVNTSSGELTPPCTPTDSQFLALTFSPSHVSGESGAVQAANIARTYNFDLVYVIRLWPKGEGVRFDPSRQSTSRSPMPQGRSRKEKSADDAASQRAVISNSKSKITGRLLAGYGLDKFGSPFRVHAQFHTKMLRFSGWQEYRDELASSGMISRGWTCSFYNGHALATKNQDDGPQSQIIDRGIVFAAYSRKTTKSAIPVRSSPKQTAVLGKLLYDAQTLVDALVHGV